MWNIAVKPENKVPLWKNGGVRAAVLGGAAADQPEVVRIKALGVLRHLAGAPPNKVHIM